MNIRTIVLCAACCAMPGCATNQQTAALECGAGGGGVSYGLCKAFGGSSETCNRMAVLGAGAGALACYHYAGNLEKRRQALAGKENDLDARIKYVQALNRDTEQLNEQLRGKVAEMTRRTDDLVRQTRAGKITLEQRQRERARLDDETAASRQQVALGREALDEMKQFRARRGQESQALDAEIARQERLLQEAERQTSAMAAQRRRV